MSSAGKSPGHQTILIASMSWETYRSDDSNPFINTLLKEFDFKEVPWENGRSVLVLRIPQSWGRPHQVKNTNLFYGRSPAGAYPLDVSELQELFEMSEHLPQRANSFIDEQINKVIAGKRPVQMTTAVLGQSYSHAAIKVVFHVIPISAFSRATHLNIASISALLAQRLKPLSGYPVPRRTLLNRMNLDGWVAYEDDREQTKSYV